LLHLLERSAQHVRHASESVENRGLKTLLKVLAQERVVMVNALRQAVGKDIDDPLDPDNKSGAASLQEGMQDIQASMTVQRQGRENVALNHLLEAEDELLRAYEASLQDTMSPQLRSMLESQQAHIAQFYRRLQAVGAGIEPIVARVFDSRVEGESAVARLRERGLNPGQIDVASITQVARPVLQTAVATASPRKSVAAGAFSGAVIGAIIGLVLASFVWFAPESVGWITFGPWLLFLGATLLGTALGTVFGFFIGQSQREDDIAVTVDSLVNGEILVVAYPSPQQIAVAEDVLQVHHARELNR
jgi:uncharacterized protein (TIGR02284 family)